MSEKRRACENNMPEGYVTHRKFLSDGKFLVACGAAGVKPTKRQAAKFRSGRGAAHARRNG